MEKTITIQNIPVFYTDEGGGTPILILHGWQSSSRSWKKVREPLVRKGYRVIVPDLPGFGRTPAPSSAWGVEDYMKFVRAFTQTLKLDSFALVGHSFGGRIAIFYAASHEGEIKSLVLCDAAGIFRHKELKIRIHSILTKVGDFIFKAPLLRMLRPLVRKVWYILAHEKDYYLTSGTMRETFKRVIEENLRSKLQYIVMPTLILWGEDDIETPLQDAEIIHKNIANSHLHVFPGVGHAINLEIPNEIAEKIGEFI